MSTVLDLQKKYLSRLPPLDSDLILATAADKTKEYILIHPEYKFSFCRKLFFLFLLSKYKKGFPIAYLTGKKEFFGLNFRVNKHTLIPRPETELLVEEVLKKIRSGSILIDVGTGSGCIPISILKTSKIEDTNTIAIDISKPALSVAKNNALTHQVKIIFLWGNLLRPAIDLIRKITLESPDSKLIITANLPYLTQHQLDTEPSIKYEPRSALVANEGGLALYRELLEQVELLERPFTAFFEFDPQQTNLLKTLILSIFPKAKPEIMKDLAGQDRLVIFSSD